MYQDKEQLGNEVLVLDGYMNDVITDLCYNGVFSWLHLIPYSGFLS